MAEHSRFFDSIDPNNPDRTYSAKEFIAIFRALVTSGVMKGEGNMLQVKANGANMLTSVDTGLAFILGHQYENDSVLALTHEVESVGKSRIDRVVLRLNLDVEARYIRAFVKRGVAGTAPIVPPLTRNENVYEISLAQVKVIGGQTFINVADVTDERGKEDVCPWSGSKILPNFDSSALADLVQQVNELTSLPPYTPVVYEAGYTDSTSNYHGLQFYKDGLGVIHLAGAFSKNAGAATTVCKLPVEYRPSKVVSGIAFRNGLGVFQATIVPNGDVSINTTETGTMSLGFSFRTD